ncbi:hypothetical protein [Actinoallomurus oryzae]
MACWMSRRVRDGRTGPPASGADGSVATARRVSLARIRARGRFSVLFGRAAGLTSRALDRGPAWLRDLGGLRRLAARRRATADAGRFMDYGPDWPPGPTAPRRRHPLLRRCVAAVVLYAVIWAVGSALLEIRLFQLRKLGGGAPETTYTTVTEPRQR